MITRRLLVNLSASLLGLTLAGCKPPPTYNVARANVADVKNSIDEEENKQYPAPAPVVTKTSPYVDTTKVSLIRPPAWLNRQITMRGNSLPFSFYVSEALNDTGALVQFDKSVDKKQLISVEYSGDIRGALDDIATRTDYYYDVDYQKNTVTWSGFMTKIFDISFMPGDTTYRVGRGKGGGNQSLGEVAFGFDVTKDDQYSQLAGDVSLWKELDSTIQTLMSEDGRVNISQATTSVTVSDHPANVKAVGKYIKKMNHELSKQVRLHVDILEVRLRDEFQQGINWDLVHTAGKQLVSFNSPSFDNVGLTTDLVGSGFTFSATDASSVWATSNTIIQYLEFQGEVSALNRPTLTTLNNQVAQLAVQQLENYISEISNTLNDNFTQASAETSTLSTGIMVYLLPKIKNNEVFLQVSTNLSILLDLSTINTSNGQIVASGSEDPDQTAGTSSVVLQLPKVASRMMNQRAVIPSGKCLVLTGFKQLVDETNTTQLFGFQALGGMASSRNATEIVMLITPTILTPDDEVEDIA